MGYRSDIRIRLTKEDFNKLVEEFDKELIQTKKLELNLFEHLDIYKKEEDYEYYTQDENHEWITHKENCVYFGWDCVKWYDDYEDVEFINNFIFNCKQYAFIKIGESSKGDIDSRAEGFDNIGYSYIFDDDDNFNDDIEED